MNMIIVDATPAAGAKENDIVTIIGQDARQAISADELAKYAASINYELVARIVEHLPRFVI
jgi:alanine racemase